METIENYWPIWICTAFTGHYPVGSAAVVCARTAEEAADSLNHTLRTGHRLKGDAKPADMHRIYPTLGSTYVLCDGDY